MVKKFLQYLGEAFTRKKKSQSSANVVTELSRCLSTFDLTFIGIGSTIGAGIYVLTGDVAKNKTGPAIIFSFLIAAVCSLLSGICYGEFGARIPKAGSAYVYVYITLGELCGFFIGWNMFLEYIIGGSSIARGLSAYINSLTHGSIQEGTIFLIGEMNVPYLSNYFDLFSLILVLFFTVILSTGVKDSARLNNACVIINLLTIVLVICVGLANAKKKNWDDFAPYGVSGVFSGAATCFFSFIGFDVIANASEEAKNPKFSVPVSMALTIVICFLAYFGVSAAVTLMVPYQLLDENAAVANAFHQTGQKFMGHLIGVGATLGLSGCTLISMLPLPRLLYALSQDGMIFKCFAKVDERTGVPVLATFVSGALIGLLAVILDLNSLVEMLSIGTLLAYTVVDVCVILLRYRKQLDEDDLNIRVEQHQTDAGYAAVLEKDDIIANYKRKNYLLNFSVLVILLSAFGMAILLRVYGSNLPLAVSISIGVLGVFIFASCVYLSLCKQNEEDLSFKTPFVPWLPSIGVFLNSYLMTSLSKETWIRLGVWAVIGFFLYFGYGIRHSAEAKPRSQNTTSSSE